MNQKQLPQSSESTEPKKGDKPKWKGEGEIAIWENKDKNGETYFNVQVKARAFQNWPLDAK